MKKKLSVKKQLIRKGVSVAGDPCYYVYLDPWCTEEFETRTAARKYVKRNLKEILERRASYDF